MNLVLRSTFLMPPCWQKACFLISATLLAILPSLSLVQNPRLLPHVVAASLARSPFNAFILRRKVHHTLSLSFLTLFSHAAIHY